MPTNMGGTTAPNPDPIVVFLEHLRGLDLTLYVHPEREEPYMAVPGDTVRTYYPIAGRRVGRWLWAQFMELKLPTNSRQRESGVNSKHRREAPMARQRKTYTPEYKLAAVKMRFDWLVFDEGYSSKVPLLHALDAVSQQFVGEVPVSFSVKTATSDEPRRADLVLSADDAKRGRRFRLSRKTVGDTRWRATSRLIEVHGCRWMLVVAQSESTAEVKYFITKATDEPLSRVLRVAFRRATVEYRFRVAKSEAGLTHYEGRQYVGLLRHLILSLVVLGFVSIHTDRLREEKTRK